jgi:hypothetical protein
MTGWMTSVLLALNAAGVRYLTVGGVAVVLHGRLRATKDLDLVIQLGDENLRRALAALTDAGYRPKIPVAMQEFADAAQRDAWRTERNMVVFQLRNPDVRLAHIDVFVYEPFDFDAVYAAAVHVPTNSVVVPVVPLEQLLAMKRTAGRAQDLADIEALEMLRDAAASRDTDGDA